MNLRYNALLAGANKTKSQDNRTAIAYILQSAKENADHTIRDEHLPQAKWDEIFVGSISTLLSPGNYNRYVAAFFATRGINY